MIVGAPADLSWNTDVQSKIVGTGLISGSVDVFDASLGTPTLSQLQAYDAVLFYSDTGFADRDTLGNNLADYVDGGGGVVEATFAFWDSSGGGIAIGGRWRSDGYDIWTPGFQDSPSLTFSGTTMTPAIQFSMA
ncbi:MAG: hypothetical protein U0992_07820 [Planctomycetaceae bacterium]